MSMMVANILQKNIGHGINMTKTKNKLVKTENEGKHLSGGFVIPQEVVDGIVKAALIEARDYHKDDLAKHFSDPKKYGIHPDDITIYHELVYCMNKLINYYGGE
jgi:hypothetical protein